MTANAMAGDREAALAAGMNDHIIKPIDVPAGDVRDHRALGRRGGVSDDGPQRLEHVRAAA